jgi:hypothetical protein
MISGFEFDGNNRTIWLKEAKQVYLLTVLKRWICSDKTSSIGIPFKEFGSVLAKIRQAFTAISAGWGLLTPCNKILQKKTLIVYLHRNLVLLVAISGCQTFAPGVLRPPHLVP